MTWLDWMRLGLSGLTLLAVAAQIAVMVAERADRAAHLRALESHADELQKMLDRVSK